MLINQQISTERLAFTDTSTQQLVIVLSKNYNSYHLSKGIGLGTKKIEVILTLIFHKYVCF